MKILLLEDDGKTASYLTKGLTSEGHVVDHVTDGRDALALGLDSAVFRRGILTPLAG